MVERLEMVDQGLGLNAEEASWALRQAFKHRKHLAFSKRELGLCTRVVYDIALEDPG